MYFQVYFTLYFYVYFLIYKLSYTNYYYNNNHYTIGNLFLPVCCVDLVVVCVFPVGSSGLLKLSQPGKYWQAWYLLESGVGGGAVLGDMFLRE